MFLENTPHSDRPGISEILSEQRCCDLCNLKQDLIDLAPCPTGNGFYCEDCIKNGDVTSYLRREYKYDAIQINNFLKTIKL